ncbi:hypothetical protein STENM327S_05936 [Streptomyces tendae]
MDDVGVRLRAEAADHQHRNARVGEPSGELLAKGVLFGGDVRGVLLALGAIEAEPAGHLRDERVHGWPANTAAVNAPGSAP